jgi:hypothetical protein
MADPVHRLGPIQETLYVLLIMVFAPGLGFFLGWGLLVVIGQLESLLTLLEPIP